MPIEKNKKWTRSPTFKKYFATAFGIRKEGNYIRLEFGDERVKFSEKDIANVSECQIIMDGKSFKTFLNLLKQYNLDITKKK